jgi:transketolase
MGMREAFMHRLLERAREDAGIVLITGDLGFGVIDKFEQELPEQFLNAGVAEQDMTGVAAGLALGGLRPFTYSIGNFATLRCLEQLRNDCAYHDLPVTAVAVGGGFSYGPLGFSHFATEDLAVMRAIPGITVLAPGCSWEAAGIVDALVERTTGCVYVRLDKSEAAPTGRPAETFAIGPPRLLREGVDVALITTGGILGEALKAAVVLDLMGVSASVLHIPTVSPFDQGAFVGIAESVRCLVVIEEHCRSGGLYGAVAEAMVARGMARPVVSIAIPDEFARVVGSQTYLRRLYGMDAAAIAERAAALAGPQK